jgi:hypothetical protein
MNRSILIVICDFLLVSLLAFSTVDINKVSDTGTPRSITIDIATNQPESGKDLTAVMRMALSDERQQRERLLGELSHARETATTRETQVKSLQEQLQQKQQEAAQLGQEQSGLQQQYSSAQTNIQALSAEVQRTVQEAQRNAEEAAASRNRLAEMQAELRKQVEQAAALQKQMSHLEQSNQLAQAEKQQLAGRLQVAETEKRMASEQVSTMRDEVKTEREEKAKLAEGVKALASKSGQLVQEIRENRPLTANTIFSEFMTNRVQARFVASRAGLIGTSKRSQTQTVLVSDGTNTFALCHVQDTPLTLAPSARDWDALTGSLERNETRLPIQSVSFYFEDPRVVLIPLSTAQVKQLGSKVYRISSDPYKFQDAVLVGAAEGYYGECRFQIDASTPEYVKLDRSFLKGLFGQFNPSRGDLVFSKSGELLGVMANNSYCLRIRDFSPAATLAFGRGAKPENTGDTLARLYAFVANKPSRLQ